MERRASLLSSWLCWENSQPVSIIYQIMCYATTI